MVTAPEKRCRICGNDCSRTERVKNAQGQYACRECWREEQAALTARRRGNPVEPDPSRSAVIDPALAETKLDEDPPSDHTPADPPASADVEYQPDRSGVSSSQTDVGQALEVAVDAPQVPRDRSAVNRTAGASHLLTLAACAVVTLAAAAGVHASVVEESARLPAAGNGAMSGLLQIGCTWVIFGLGTLIWIERTRAWSWCLAVLAVGAGVVNLVGLASMYVPYAGWAITLGACAVAARYALDLPWSQAGYLAVAMFITTTGVRVALSPRELDHAAEWIEPRTSADLPPSTPARPPTPGTP